jgi:cytochrome c-type biogenesis protein
MSVHHILAASSASTAGGVGIPVAIAAGLLSFLSPCVLPLVPGYLSTVIGVSPTELAGSGPRRVLVPSLLFIASFSLIFILLGLGATAIGSTLKAHQATLEHIGAVVIIAMGVLFIAAPFVGVLSRQWHSQSLLHFAGRGGPIVAGAAFAFAWTPCIGPTLGAILGIAAISGSALHGAVLLAFYSAGLAIPFLVTALAFERMTSAFAHVKRHFGLLIAIGGAVLIAMGVLIWTGEFTILNAEANSFLQSSGLNFTSI